LGALVAAKCIERNKVV